MASIQQQRKVVMSSRSQSIARQLYRSLHTSKGKGAAAVPQARRPSTHAATIDSDSAASPQVMLHEARRGAHEEWAPPPLARLQTAVDRFSQQYFIDELPSRTQRSIVDAAAAGKGYVTPEDITRVLANMSGGKHVLSDLEAGSICETWGENTQQPPTISTDAFLRLLETPTSK